MLWTRRVFCEVRCCRVCVCVCVCGVCVCVCDCNVKAQRSMLCTVPTMTRKFVITLRYTILQQQKKSSQILKTSKLQQVMILRSFWFTNCLVVLESQCDELYALRQIGVSWPLCGSWAKKRIFLIEKIWTVSTSELGEDRWSESHILIKSVKNLYSCFLHLSFHSRKIRCKKYARNAVEIFEFHGNRRWNAALFLWAINETMPTI